MVLVHSPHPTTFDSFLSKGLVAAINAYSFVLKYG